MSDRTPVSRPELLVAVCGTATEIGKTWVAARCAETLMGRGVDVVARKPVQSFAAADDATDADVLALATGDDPDLVCPPHRCYPVPMAPPMAAARLGRPSPTIDELVSELRWPPPSAVGLLETVGGVRSPIAEDGDSRDLVRAVGADVVVLVADAGLGVIDAVRGGVDALAPLPVLVFLNRYDGADELHALNRSWLIERDGLTVLDSVEDLATALVPRRA